VVKDLVPRGSHGALGEGIRLWRAHRRNDHLCAFGTDHLVEGARVLGVTVADHEAHGAILVLQLGGEVAGLLGDEAGVGVARGGEESRLREPISMKNET